MTDEELVEEREPLGGPRARSTQRAGQASRRAYTFSFPAQDHRIGEDSDDRRPADGRRSAGERRRRSTTSARTITIKRGPILAGGRPAPVASSRRASCRAGSRPRASCGPARRSRRIGLGESRDDAPATAGLASVRDLLLRRAAARRAGPGRRRSGGPARRRSTPRRASCRRCRRGVLPIQGPPGSGKTYTGARMIVALVAAGKRVGVVANSHKVIGNLLDEVAEGRRSRLGQSRSASARSRRAARRRRTRPRPCSTDNADVEAALRRGPSTWSARWPWTWCRPEFATAEPVLDVLFVDEAGQMSLANVLALRAGRADASSCSATRSSSTSRPRDAPARRRAQRPVAPARRSRLPAAGPGDDPAARGAVPRHDLAPAPGPLRLHVARCSTTAGSARATGLERQARRSPRASAGPLSGTGLRYLPVAARGQRHGLGRGGDGVAELVAVAARDAADVDRPRRARGARSTVDDIVIVAPVQRPGRRDRASRGDRRAAAAVRRDRRQVPGPGGPDQHLLDGRPRRPEDAPRGHGVPVHAQPPERRDVAGEVRRRDRRCRPRWSGSRAGRRARCGWPTACAWPSSRRRRRPRASPGPAPSDVDRLVLFPHLDGGADPIG